MIDRPSQPEIGTELQRINDELARLLRTEPIELAVGTDRTMRDDLVVCGIVGGKDVGKSTLINALAQRSVSREPEEVGEGTVRPMAYVHEAMQDVLMQRLTGLGDGLAVDVSVHESDAIQNVVLVDLPDFDSEFLHHLETVRGITPLQDRILWVVTPRKIADREWVRMFKRVVQDQTNVHCVLNKVDELLSDDDFFERAPGASGGQNGRSAQIFWRQQQDWMQGLLESADYRQTEDHRFLVAAGFPDADRFVRRVSELWDDPTWSKYDDDRAVVEEIGRLASDELNRLRGCVHSPISLEESRALKAANRDRELEVNASRIERHYGVAQALERLAQACDPEYLQRALNDAIDPEYVERVACSIAGQMRSDAELADELFETRVQHWPLLRLTYWPFGWLSRTVGRRIAPLSARRYGSPAGPIRDMLASADEPFDGGEASPPYLKDRICLVRARLLADHAVIAERLKVEADWPDLDTQSSHVRRAGAGLAPRLEAALLDAIAGRDRKPSWVGRFALWLVLLWFPLLQPVLAGVLEIFNETGSFQVIHGLYKIVSALSAVHLLAGLAVVAVIFVALLAAMYARALRTIRRHRSDFLGTGAIIESIDELLISEVMLPLAKPFRELLERLQTLRSRLAGIR